MKLTIREVISADGRHAEVLLDDQDITSAVRSLELHMEAAQLTTAKLELFLRGTDIEVELDAVVVQDPSTKRLDIARGLQLKASKGARR